MTIRQTLFIFLFVSPVSTLLLCGSTKAQLIYKQTGDSYITISGTSTLHEWTMTSKEGKTQATFEFNEHGTPARLNSLLVSVRSESLKSGHSAMDKNAYSTLNTDTHKTIKFSMVSATIVNTKIQCEGDLTVSGVTKRITLEANCKVLSNQSMLCSGTKKIRMSDYAIEAPTFMFGTVTTGDEITVSFNVNLAPVKK